MICFLNLEICISYSCGDATAFVERSENIPARYGVAEQ